MITHWSDVFTRAWWHERWEWWHPYLIFLLSHQRWTFFVGDPSRPNKGDGSEWREQWPWAVLQPKRDGIPYGGPYFLIFWVEVPPKYRCISMRCFPLRGVAWCKLLPTRGRVAIRIGDGDVHFTAIAWWGKSLMLEVHDRDLSREEVPKDVTLA